MAIQNDLMAAVEQIAHERRIAPEAVVASLEASIVAAYKKHNEDYREANIRCEINTSTAEIKLFLGREVVKKVEDKTLEIALKEAQKLVDDIAEGDQIETELVVDEEVFGRIAAQAAKQVIMQKIREEEKKSVIEEYSDKVGTIVSGNVQRVYRGDVIVEFGKATGIMPADEKIYQEYYKTGEAYKFLLKDVLDNISESPYNSQLLLSRKDPEFLIQLFALEVPEIASGTVEIKAVAREEGARSKLAVASNQEGVDPIGSCVGQKGLRIMNIQNELSDNKYEEKIDIIEWDDDPAQFVANSLSPAKVDDVILDEETQTATVLVDEDQLSLAIGKEGQNVRLAHKLTNWKIEINPGKEDSISSDDVAEDNSEAEEEE